MGRTMSNDPLQKFRFSVEIEGAEMGANNVNGLEKELEVGEYREGGYDATHKLPGVPSTGTMTIERGAFADKVMYQQFKDSLDASEDFRKTVTVIERNRRKEPVRQWTLYECWASKFTAPELDATSSDPSMDNLEIQYEDFDLEVL